MSPPPSPWGGETCIWKGLGPSLWPYLQGLKPASPEFSNSPHCCTTKTPANIWSEIILGLEMLNNFTVTCHGNQRDLNPRLLCTTKTQRSSGEMLYWTLLTWGAVVRCYTGHYLHEEQWWDVILDITYMRSSGEMLYWTLLTWGAVVRCYTGHQRLHLTLQFTWLLNHHQCNAKEMMELRH